MDTVWNIEKIQQILPHRYPFIFVDRVVEIDEAAKKIVCLKNLTINDYFFAGHFPEQPVMPGVIMIEALAQAAILLYAALKPEIAAKKPIYYLGKVEAKFLKVVQPGDTLLLEIIAERLTASAGIVNARALVGTEPAVEARLMFGIK